jgi:hypothetical protein
MLRIQAHSRALSVVTLVFFLVDAVGWGLELEFKRSAVSFRKNDSIGENSPARVVDPY